MSSFISNYIEHPVLCMQCGELVACRVQEMLDHLEKGNSFPATMDLMGITFDCTREAFFNPHVEEIDCRNEELIEGNISYKQGLKPDLKFRYHESYQPKELIVSDKKPTVVGMPEIVQSAERPWVESYIGSGRYAFHTNGAVYYAT